MATPTVHGAVGARISRWQRARIRLVLLVGVLALALTIGLGLHDHAADAEGGSLPLVALHAGRSGGP